MRAREGGRRDLRYTSGCHRSRMEYEHLMCPANTAVICVLTHGADTSYFARCLDSLLNSGLPPGTSLRVGINDSVAAYEALIGRIGSTVSTRRYENVSGSVTIGLEKCPSAHPIVIWNSPVNLYKEPMARRMFYDVPIETEYVIWFDDDSYVEPGWWEALLPLLEQKIDYIGQEWWVYYLPGQADMIRAQPWYRRVPFEVREGRPGVKFVTGGFMAVRTECLYEANFPDVEFSWKGDTLKQYGGDTLLGEVARQLGWSRARHDKFVKVNVDLNGNHPAPRRGGTGRQFGSDVDVVIK